MTQEVPTEDLIFGGAILAVFLVCVFAAGKLLYKFRNARFTKAWTPLVAIVNGTVAGDGGGSATSWLTGTYRGRQVRATMVPNRNRHHSDTGPRFNYFDVALLNVAGKRDWSFVRHGNRWHVEAEDKRLEASLRESGAVDKLSSYGDPTISYNALQRTLLYSEDVTPRWIPTPERFQEELQILLDLEMLNEEVNSPS